MAASLCSDLRLLSDIAAGGTNESFGGCFWTKEELHFVAGRSSTGAGSGDSSSMFLDPEIAFSGVLGAGGPLVGDAGELLAGCLLGDAVFTNFEISG